MTRAEGNNDDVDGIDVRINSTENDNGCVVLPMTCPRYLLNDK